MVNVRSASDGTNGQQVPPDGARWWGLSVRLGTSPASGLEEAADKPTRKLNSWKLKKRDN